MENVIIHVPHASLKLPKEFYERLVIPVDRIEKENIFVADYLVDKFIPMNWPNIIKFDFSRLFCDVERFKDDKLEIMAQYGMGVVYKKTHLGKEFIELDDDYLKMVFENYYDVYHKLLDDKASDILDKFDKCYILELHSYSDQFVGKVLGLFDNPDICIGYEEVNCDPCLLTITIEHFKKYGYSVMENYPYSGSLIPNKYYNVSDSNVYSLMIEINKRLYLEDNICLDDSGYLKLKKCMDEYYKLLDNYVRENR